MMGEAYAGPRSAIPGVTSPLVPPAIETPQTPAAARGHTDILNDLFRKLAATRDAAEAGAIASRIGAMWLQSGSDTADLLMSRALDASRKGRHDTALALFNRLVLLQPGWAEAWQKRAFLRVIDGDRSGAMEDIARVLRLEPRHFVALASMAMLLRQQGMTREALAVVRKAALLYPADVDLRDMIDQLGPIVEGRRG